MTVLFNHFRLVDRGVVFLVDKVPTGKKFWHYWLQKLINNWDIHLGIDITSKNFKNTLSMPCYGTPDINMKSSILWRSVTPVEIRSKTAFSCLLPHLDMVSLANFYSTFLCEYNLLPIIVYNVIIAIRLAALFIW